MQAAPADVFQRIANAPIPAHQENLGKAEKAGNPSGVRFWRLRYWEELQAIALLGGSEAFGADHALVRAEAQERLSLDS